MAASNLDDSQNHYKQSQASTRNPPETCRAPPRRKRDKWADNVRTQLHISHCFIFMYFESTSRRFLELAARLLAHVAYFRIPCRRINQQTKWVAGVGKIEQSAALVRQEVASLRPGLILLQEEFLGRVGVFSRELCGRRNIHSASYPTQLTLCYVNFALMIYVAIKFKHLRIVGNCNVLSSPRDIRLTLIC